MNHVSDIVERVFREWKQDPERPSDPYKINDGWCGQFADEVKDRVHNPQIVVWDTRTAQNTLEDERLVFSPGHIWVVDTRNMVHYDAEARGGVDFWYELPIFARTLEEE